MYGSRICRTPQVEDPQTNLAMNLWSRELTGLNTFHSGGLFFPQNAKNKLSIMLNYLAKCESVNVLQIYSDLLAADYSRLHILM